jgi:hypothetical protein
VGIGRPADAAGAARLRKRRCDSGDGVACAAYAAHLESTGQRRADRVARRAWKLLRRACDKKRARHCTTLAERLMSGGLGLPRDERQASRLYQRACSAGDATGCVTLARSLARGPARDRTRARAGFERALKLNQAHCEAGDPVACHDLGVQHARGWGVPESQERFRHFERLACQRGLESVSCRRYPSARPRPAPAKGVRICGTTVDRDVEQILCTGSGLTDLSPLTGFPRLVGLYLERNPLVDLSPLSRIPTLELLLLNGTRVKDLSPLRGLKQLRILELNKTRVSDLAPLAGLTRLRRIKASHTAVTDLSPLAALRRLYYLDLSNTRVAVLKPLKHLGVLELLYLAQTRVKDLSPLSRMRRLKELDLRGTPVPASEVKRFRAAHRKCEVRGP